LKRRDRQSTLILGGVGEMDRSWLNLELRVTEDTTDRATKKELEGEEAPWEAKILLGDRAHVKGGDGCAKKKPIR